MGDNKRIHVWVDQALCEANVLENHIVHGEQMILEHGEHKAEVLDGHAPVVARMGAARFHPKGRSTLQCAIHQSDSLQRSEVAAADMAPWI